MSDTPFGSIVDVDGIGVGHHQRTGPGWQTGTTVLTARNGAVPGVDVRGGGPGTRETDALRPENLIEEIHAITLTGGSAYGLAAADGVVAVLETAGLGFAIIDHVVPVVPGAVIFDLGRGGDFAKRPDASFGARAASAALRTRSRPKWGAVGAGTGARAGGLQGGVGTASATVQVDDIGYTVGALAVVNSNGSAIDPATGWLWEPNGHPMPRLDRMTRNRLHGALTGQAEVGLNTTIGVVATNATLDKAMSHKLASVAHDGLARAIRPAHSMTDGDTVFALATGEVPLGERLTCLNALLRASAEVFSAACSHAVLSATTIGDAPSWSELVGL